MVIDFVVAEVSDDVTSVFLELNVARVRVATTGSVLDALVTYEESEGEAGDENKTGK